MRILRNITGREGSGLGREKRPPPPNLGKGETHDGLAATAPS